jgi:xanthine dehydrogenase large subunit
VVIDTLTGESRVLAADILHDVGTSINPALDIGQIEGAFIQGMGWLTTEELVWNGKGGWPPTRPAPTRSPPRATCRRTSRSTCGPSRTARTTCSAARPWASRPSCWPSASGRRLRDAVAAARGDGTARMDAPATAERVLGALKVR